MTATVPVFGFVSDFNMLSHERELSPSGCEVKPNGSSRVLLAHCSVGVRGFKSTCIHKEDELKAVSYGTLQYIYRGNESCKSLRVKGS